MKSRRNEDNHCAFKVVQDCVINGEQVFSQPVGGVYPPPKYTIDITFINFSDKLGIIPSHFMPMDISSVEHEKFYRE